MVIISEEIFVCMTRLLRWHFPHQHSLVLKNNQFQSMPFRPCLGLNIVLVMHRSLAFNLNMATVKYTV